MIKKKHKTQMKINKTNKHKKHKKTAKNAYKETYDRHFKTVCKYFD